MTSFAGTANLLRLSIRRDRFILPIWVLLPCLAFWGQISFTMAMPDWQAFLAELSASPLTGAILGPIVPLTLEGAIMWRSTVQGAMVLMISAPLVVIRHTRSEETSGRAELYLSRPTDKFAPFMAALILSMGGCLTAGVLISIVLLVSGFAVEGSVLAGLTVAFSGCFFAGSALITAQAFTAPKSAWIAVTMLVGSTYFTMVMNNLSGGISGWIWLAPESWYRLTVPFGSNFVWPLFVFAFICLAAVGRAFALLRNRDIGGGLFAEPAGNTKAPKFLTTPFALNLWQNKNTALFWGLGMAFIGAAIGAIVPTIADQMSEMLAGFASWGPAMAKLGNQEGFAALMIYMLGLMGAGSVFVISIMTGLKSDESAGYAEMMLAKPISRVRYMVSFIAMVFLYIAVILTALGFAAGIGWSIVTGDGAFILKALGMSISKIPSLWLITGFAAFLYGVAPKIQTVLSSLLIGALIVLEMFWEVGLVPWSVLAPTPFGIAHYSIPIDELSILPLAIAAILAFGLTFLGVRGFIKRNIISG